MYIYSTAQRVNRIHLYPPHAPVSLSLSPLPPSLTLSPCLLLHYGMAGRGPAQREIIYSQALPPPVSLSFAPPSLYFTLSYHILPIFYTTEWRGPALQETIYSQALPPSVSLSFAPLSLFHSLLPHHGAARRVDTTLIYAHPPPVSLFFGERERELPNSFQTFHTIVFSPRTIANLRLLLITYKIDIFC